MVWEFGIGFGIGKLLQQKHAIWVFCARQHGWNARAMVDPVKWKWKWNMRKVRACMAFKDTPQNHTHSVVVRPF